MANDKGQILLYQTPDGESRIEVRLQGETVWLSLEQMTELFQRNKSTISRHIKNVFEEGELQPDTTVAFFATVQMEGKRKVERDIAYYNLDMIISVGYRVHSYRGVQFRMWATKVLKEYIVKGFALNDDATISTNCWLAFATFAHRKRCSTGRCSRSMHSALTTTLAWR